MYSAISILPIEPADYYPIAALEARCFNDDPISVYAFGPDRASPATRQKRAHSLATTSSYPPERMRKAINELGQIAGFAIWKFYTDLAQNPPSDGQKEDQAKATEADTGTVSESKWPEGANAQLCEAVFGMSDELCKLSMRGRKYAGMLH
jgi:hypothetical protein